MSLGEIQTASTGAFVLVMVVWYVCARSASCTYPGMPEGVDPHEGRQTRLLRVAAWLIFLGKQVIYVVQAVLDLDPLWYVALTMVMLMVTAWVVRRAMESCQRHAHRHEMAEEALRQGWYPYGYDC